MVVILISKPSGSGEQWLSDPSLISFPIHLSHLMACRSKGTQSRAFVTSGLAVTNTSEFICAVMEIYSETSEPNPPGNTHLC